MPDSPAPIVVQSVDESCALCGQPKGADYRDRPRCHDCAIGATPPGSLGEGLYDIYQWLLADPRSPEAARTLFRRYDGLYEMFRLAHQNLDYRRHDGFHEADFGPDTWDRLVRWLVDRCFPGDDRPPLARDLVLRLPRAEVLRLLREAFKPGGDMSRQDTDWAVELKKQFPRAKLQAGLVEYMRCRDVASFADIADRVYGDNVVDVDGGAIRQLVGRVNGSLIEINAPIRFKCGGEHVIREVLPE